MADDDYNPDVLDGDDAGQGDDADLYEPTRERIIALIDADSSMLARLAEEGDEEHSYLTWAVRLVSGIMQDRIRLAPADEFGIIFYSTEKKKSGAADRVFDHTYEYLTLDRPLARDIRDLMAFDDAAFQERPGCTDTSATPSQAAKDLQSALFMCWDVFCRRDPGSTNYRSRSAAAGKGKPRTARTVLIFTNNPNPLVGAADPGHLKEQLDIRAQELGSLSAHIEVIPLIQLADPAAFDYTAFWAPLLAEARSMAAAAAGAAAGSSASAADVDDDDDLADLADEAAEGIEHKILRVKGLGLRSATGRKRHLAVLTWTLAPGLRIGVKTYALVQPAKKPHHTWVAAHTNNEVSKTRALIDYDTGVLLNEVKYRAFAPTLRGGGGGDVGAAAGVAAGSAAEAEAGVGPRFPKVIVRQEEVVTLKSLRPRGLTLLGFKPASLLRDTACLGPSRFVYPDERSLRGSTAAFVALHAACLEDDGNPQMAVCSYVPRPAAVPQLVALLPQAEERDEDGIQATPPGFHLIPLPFKDDMRAPENDASLVSRVAGAGAAAPPRANAAQVAAAAALVAALSVDATDEEGAPNPFSTEVISNPSLERHFQVLEALALGEPVPDTQELVDDTEPDWAGIAQQQPVLDAFKVAVFGSVDGPPELAPKTAAKRKASDPAIQKAIAEEYAEHDWAALAAPGAATPLSSLTVPALKVYLEYHGLRLGGNKATLIERITEHLQQQAASAAARQTFDAMRAAASAAGGGGS